MKICFNWSRRFSWSCMYSQMRAFMLSAPCSPINPIPRWYFLSHHTICSSSRCSFGSIDALRKCLGKIDPIEGHEALDIWFYKMQHITWQSVSHISLIDHHSTIAPMARPKPIRNLSRTVFTGSDMPGFGEVSVMPAKRTLLPLWLNRSLCLHFWLPVSSWHTLAGCQLKTL